MRAALLSALLIVTSPALARQDLDGSFDDLALAFQGQVEALVEGRLRDPQAVQYRNMRQLTRADGSTVVCGELNPRNGYGGYGGFEPFAIIAHGDKFSTYNPVVFSPESRPALRDAVRRAGC